LRSPEPSVSTSAVTAEGFRVALNSVFIAAQRRGEGTVEVSAKDLHRRAGGYQSSNHRLPTCCDVMRSEMRDGDIVVQEPPKGRGASLTIRYIIPRNVDRAVPCSRVPL
jgi:5-methylcytosine-specific restriction protein A